MSNTLQPGDIAATLRASERAGLRWVLDVRSVLVGVLLSFILITQGPVQGAFGASVTFVFLVIGLAYRWLVVRERDAQWMRYGFVTLDIALLGVVAATLPLSIHGDVPQIFVFRVYGVGIFFFVLATSALSLSPRLALWTGAASVAAIWAVWAYIIAGMERWVTWADLPGDRTAERYIEIVLDPDMISISNRFIESLLILTTAAVTAAAVERARRLLRRQMAAERARSQMTEVFGRFVPAEVAETLGASGGALPPAERVATVMFVDIEGFTRFAEGSEPERIVSVLDAFFDAVSEVITAERGVVISFIGDAALAAFNAPLDNTEHAGAALRAAQRLLERCDRQDFDGQHFRIRIGIATGPVAAGTVGGRGRRAYTLYGDTVNLAQRLEALNKDTGTRLLVAESTWDQAGRPAGLSRRETLTVRGRREPVAVYAQQDAQPAAVG